MAAARLIIFDCDGVLIDSEAIACRVDAECLTEAGFPTSVADVVVLGLGVSEKSFLEALEAHHGRRLPADIAERMRASVLEAFDRELAPIAGIEVLLDRLAIPVCVASSSAPERLRHSLGLAGLWPRFDPHVYSATMVARGKPAPDLFLFAAERMGVSPAESVVIEDSPAGVEAGVAAGMTVYGFAGGGHCGPGHAERLRTAGAVAVATTMDELSGMLGAR